MILTAARNPDEYVECLGGWQRRHVEALRAAVFDAVPALEERLKWGHIVCFLNGPVLLIRAEPQRVLLGFWRGQRLLHVEPRLRGGGKYEMSGRLTLKGQTKPVAMKFTMTGSGATAQFAGSMNINRFDFNVGEGWNDTSWVAQEVAVEVKLDLKK